MKEGLKNAYGHVPNADAFIDAVFAVHEHREKTAILFCERALSRHNERPILGRAMNAETCIQIAKYFERNAVDKLSRGDYSGHFGSMLNVTNYRAIAHYLGAKINHPEIENFQQKPPKKRWWQI